MKRNVPIGFFDSPKESKKLKETTDETTYTNEIEKDYDTLKAFITQIDQGTIDIPQEEEIKEEINENDKTRKDIDDKLEEMKYYNRLRHALEVRIAHEKGERKEKLETLRKQKKEDLEEEDLDKDQIEYIKRIKRQKKKKKGY